MNVGLLAACDDPALFGFDLWPKQRELLADVERGPRLHVWACGRRSGKSTLAALVGLHGCLFRPDLDAKVRKGERRYSVAIATNRAQARLLVAAARSIVEASPLLAPLVSSVTEDEIAFDLESGARTAFRAFPCSSRGGRGWPISCLIADEAAHFISETDGFQTLNKVWEALVPATAQFGDGARILLSSTPYGTDGLFASLFQRASNGEIPDALAQHAPTREINPTITPEFLAQEEARDPDAFAQEYEANFTQSGDAYLDMDRVTIADRGELEPNAATRWVAGLDPSWSRDPFGLALVGRDPWDGKRLLLGRAEALKPLKGDGAFEARIDEIAVVLKRYGAKAVTDQYLAPAVIDRLRGHGVAVRAIPMSATTKTQAFGQMRARLYDGTLEVFDHPALIAELRRLRTRFSAGSAAVENPRVGGSHGDIAQALAIAVLDIGTTSSGAAVKVRTGGYTKSAADWRPRRRVGPGSDR